MALSDNVITVGNFDGVHRGHAALLCEAVKLGGRVVAYTFTDHPLKGIAPGRVPPSLCDRDEKQALLTAAGAHEVVWLDADASVLHLSPAQFVGSVVRRHKPVAWVEGPGFRFGHHRAGDANTLGQLSGEFGFEARIIPPVQAVLTDKSVVPISSSLIRWLIGQGRVMDAAVCLGRPYVVRGRVARGEQLGRKLGCPTANLTTGDRMLPADGVYAGSATVHGRDYPAAISVGVKPTLGVRPRTTEAHLIGFDGDLYEQSLDLRVSRWLREQFTFAGLDPLKCQIERDLAAVRRLWQSDMLNRECS